MSIKFTYRTEEEIEALVAAQPEDLRHICREALLKEKAKLDMEEDNNSEEVREMLKQKAKQRKPLDNILDILTGGLASKLKEKIQNVIDYEPTIGVIGTTGVGKSSLINSIFGDNICKTSSVKACTRELQKVTIDCGKRNISFIDLPGIGETNDRDEEYAKLYQETLPKLDLVLWAIKADDRAFSVAQSFYNEIIIPNHVEEKIIFVITQIDKIEADDPYDVGFSKRHCKLSTGQLASLEIKKQEITRNLAQNKNPIVGVSSPYGVNVQELVEVIINALPDRVKSNVYSTVKQEYKTDRIKKTAKEAFIREMQDKEDQEREVARRVAEEIDKLRREHQRTSKPKNIIEAGIDFVKETARKAVNKTTEVLGRVWDFFFS